MAEKIKVETNPDLAKRWLENAKQQTPETLMSFLQNLWNDYEHDYNSIVYAVAAAAVAAATATDKSPQGGITGFQAGCVMWSFITGWGALGTDGPLRMICYDNMLYPQYEAKFQKTITKDVWEYLQKKATANLKEMTTAHPDVRRHFLDIANGEIPFGYTVVDE